MTAAEHGVLKLTAYVGERKRSGGRFVGDALLDLFGRHEVASSILLRGVEGFGAKHHLRTDATLSLSEDLPAVAIALDRRERIEALMPEVEQALTEGVVTVERASLQTGSLHEVTLPERLHEATKLTVYLGRQERVGRVPAHVAVCDLLYRRGISGATAFLGVDGTARGRRERARFVGRNTDVPVMVIAVGAGADIARALPDLGDLVGQPDVTLERVRVCKRDGQLLAAPHELPPVDAAGRALWQKLMVYTSEAQLHEGRPIHRAITRRLRSTGAAGATTLRGIWGFHGSVPPHGDRLFQFGRRVPIVTIAVDTPARIAESFVAIADLTAEHGLITSELVPAMLVRTPGAPPEPLRLAEHDF